MFDKFMVGPEHLKRIRAQAQRAFSNKNPRPSDTFSPEEEKAIEKMSRAVTNKSLNLLEGNTYHEQINLLVNEFKKANFNFSKLPSGYTKKAKEAYEWFKDMLKKDKRLENTSIKVFVDAYELIHDNKIIKVAQKFKPMVDEFLKKADVESGVQPKGKKEKKRDLKKIFKGKVGKMFGYATISALCVLGIGLLSALYLIVLFMLLFFILLYMVLIIVELFRISRDDDDIRNSEKFYNHVLAIDKDHAAFTRNVTYPTAQAIEFFKGIDPEKYFNAVMNIGKSKEDLDKMGVEDYRFNETDYEDIELAYGNESFGIILAVGAGVALLAFLMVPAMRNFVYFIESWHVDMSDFYNEEAELLTNNVSMLKERLEATKDPKEREKLQKAIEKQELYIIRMRQKADKHYVREKEAEKTAEITYTNDEALFESDDKTEEMPDIII